MSKVALGVARRALLVGVAVAGLVGGWAAGSGLATHPAVPSGHVLATDGTIINEN
jgi:hypothetical protein